MPQNRAPFLHTSSFTPSARTARELESLSRETYDNPLIDSPPHRFPAAFEVRESMGLAGLVGVIVPLIGLQRQPASWQTRVLSAHLLHPASFLNEAKPGRETSGRLQGNGRGKVESIKSKRIRPSMDKNLGPLTYCVLSQEGVLD